jgi:hypothetical protein
VDARRGAAGRGGRDAAGVQQGDMQLLCSDVEPGGGRIFRCLSSRQGDVSERCGSFLRQFQARQQVQARTVDFSPQTDGRMQSSGEILADNQPRDDRARQMVTACGTDMRKLCADIEPGEGRKARCLVDRKTELSVRCRSFLQGLPVWSSEGAPPEGKKILAKCEQDMKKFCKGVEPGEGRIVQCLRAQQSGISSTCRSLLTELEQHKSE